MSALNEEQILDIVDALWKFVRETEGYAVADNMAECIVEGDMPADRLEIAIDYLRHHTWDLPLTDDSKKALEALLVLAELTIL